VVSQLSIFTADCLHHPIQMAGVETTWELHTLSVINSCEKLSCVIRVIRVILCYPCYCVAIFLAKGAMPETSRECVVVLLDESSFTVPVKVSG